MSGDVKPDFTELTLLRQFYSAWTNFHSIPRDNLHRNMKERGAQEMVDAHNSLGLFYSHHKRGVMRLAAAEGVAVPANEEVTANGG